MKKQQILSRPSNSSLTTNTCVQQESSQPNPSQNLISNTQPSNSSQTTSESIEILSKEILEGKSNADLKNLCIKYNLRKSGNKKILVATILKFFENPEAKTNKRKNNSTSTSRTKKKKFLIFPLYRKRNQLLQIIVTLWSRKKSQQALPNQKLHQQKEKLHPAKN